MAKMVNFGPTFPQNGPGLPPFPWGGNLFGHNFTFHQKPSGRLGWAFQHPLLKGPDKGI